MIFHHLITILRLTLKSLLHHFHLPRSRLLDLPKQAHGIDEVLISNALIVLPENSKALTNSCIWVWLLPLMLQVFAFTIVYIYFSSRSIKVPPEYSTLFHYPQMPQMPQISINEQACKTETETETETTGNCSKIDLNVQGCKVKFKQSKFNSQSPDFSMDSVSKVQYFTFQNITSRLLAKQCTIYEYLEHIYGKDLVLDFPDINWVEQHLKFQSDISNGSIKTEFDRFLENPDASKELAYKLHIIMDFYYQGEDENVRNAWDSYRDQFAKHIQLIISNIQTSKTGNKVISNLLVPITNYFVKGNEFADLTLFGLVIDSFFDMIAQNTYICNIAAKSCNRMLSSLAPAVVCEFFNKAICDIFKVNCINFNRQAVLLQSIKFYILVNQAILSQSQHLHHTIDVLQVVARCVDEIKIESSEKEETSLKIQLNQSETMSIHSCSSSIQETPPFTIKGNNLQPLRAVVLEAVDIYLVCNEIFLCRFIAFLNKQNRQLIYKSLFQIHTRLQSLCNHYNLEARVVRPGIRAVCI